MAKRPDDFTPEMEAMGRALAKLAEQMCAAGGGPHAEEMAAKHSETHYAAAYIYERLGDKPFDTNVIQALATLNGVWGAAGYDPWRLARAVIKLVDEETAAQEAK